MRKSFIAVLVALLCASAYSAEDVTGVLWHGGLTISGNFIINGYGERLAVRGFNNYFTAQECWQISHVAPNQRRYNRSATYFERMKQQWNVNTFRIMINEFCWLNRKEIVYGDRGIGVPDGPLLAPIDHEIAITKIVEFLQAKNMIAVITLGSARDTVQRSGSTPINTIDARPTADYIIDPSMAMPNYRNSKAVWESLAATFKKYPNVIFDPYNEPHPYLCNKDDPMYSNDCVSSACSNFEYDLEKSMACMVTGDNLDANGIPQGTACSGNGGGTNGDTGTFIPNSCAIRPPPMSKARGGSGVLGIKTIIEIIRAPDATGAPGATNLILVPGAIAGSDARKWKQYYQPNGISIDPLNKLVASVHKYSFRGDASDRCPGGMTTCQSDLEATSLKENGTGSLLGDTVPIIYGEFGSRNENEASTDGPSSPSTNCQNTIFVPSLISYAVTKQQGMLFHDATALRDPAIGFPPPGGFGPSVANNKPCSNFQAFMDHGEGVDADNVFDDGDNVIEPTIYGKQFKDNTSSLSWKYGMQAPPDTTPNDFSFTNVTNVPLGSTQISNTVTITGINVPSPVSVSGGAYGIVGSGTFITTPGSIINGQKIRVRHVAAPTPSTIRTTTLTIGGVVRTFRSTTAPP